PGLRLLEKYAVELGGGKNSRFGLDDGVVITPNHIAIIGDLSRAVQDAKEKLGYLHKISVCVSNENDVKDAIAAGADVLVIDLLSAGDVLLLVSLGNDLSQVVLMGCAGASAPDLLRAFAEAGADLIRIDPHSAPAKKITFNIQPY